MLTEREKRMVLILQRLSQWNSHMLDSTPINVLKGIVGDAEDFLEEFELPRYPPPTEPASEPSEETPVPSKILPPVDH